MSDILHRFEGDFKSNKHDLGSRLLQQRIVLSRIAYHDMEERLSQLRSVLGQFVVHNHAVRAAIHGIVPITAKPEV
jgi:hypothetical protein